MSLRDRVIRLLGGAEPARLREAAGITVDPDDDQWRRLTDDLRRDLTPLTQHRMRELAAGLWESNLLARQLVELPIAFLLAEGVTLRVPDEQAQEWLDEWWRDPITDMPMRLQELMRDVALTGEAAWPCFVDPSSGHVRMAWLDPALIETVVRDPDNVSRPIGIVTQKDRRGRARRYRVAVSGPETVFAPTARGIRETFDDGDILYFRTNAQAGGARGRSDLLAAIDWLDVYERYLYGEADRAEGLRAFLWDITISGGTAEDVKRRAAEITAPESGAVRIHNDAETWQALAPNLGGQDLESVSRLFRNHLLGGSSLPEHWFGGGGDVNRATAAEMGSPTFKSLQMRQTFWTEILRRAGEYALSRRIDPTGGSWIPPSDKDLQISVDWPPMVTEDSSKHAAAFAQATAAAAMGVERGLISEATAMRIVASAGERLGVEIDPETEIAAAREEAETRRKRQADEDSFPPPPDDEDAPPDGD